MAADPRDGQITANRFFNLLDMINKLLVGDEPVDFAALNRTMWQGLEHFWRAQAAREALYAVHAPPLSSNYWTERVHGR